MTRLGVAEDPSWKPTGHIAVSLEGSKWPPEEIDAMKLGLVCLGALLSSGCGSGGAPPAPSVEASTPEGEASAPDSSIADSALESSTTPEAATETGSTMVADASDGGAEATGPQLDGASDGGGDAQEADGGCPASWLDTTAIYAALTPDAGTAILHAAGAGTQDYQCEPTTLADGGMSFTWTLTGPEATLADCAGTTLGHHFASDGGAAAPEWQTLDGTYVIGSRKVAYTPDGGASSVAWLLLQATAHGGTGTLSNAAWISRVNTDGGVAPGMGCDSTTPSGTTTKVGYTADYYFWGP
jgi:Protein of unknown function (DUF3455)